MSDKNNVDQELLLEVANPVGCRKISIVEKNEEINKSKTNQIS